MSGRWTSFGLTFGRNGGVEPKQPGRGTTPLPGFCRACPVVGHAGHGSFEHTIRLVDRAPSFVPEVAPARRLAAIYGPDGTAPPEAPKEEVERARGRLRRSLAAHAVQLRSALELGDQMRPIQLVSQSNPVIASQSGRVIDLCGSFAWPARAVAGGYRMAIGLMIAWTAPVMRAGPRVKNASQALSFTISEVSMFSRM